ncbi:MAG: TrbI/VirB10 family protein [Betaproteobacteria bacterium]|jgi:type IV secretion system protein VirB10|nr:TrbI/VirB10 family protein [Betaproteobacteria bacterium]
MNSQIDKTLDDDDARGDSAVQDIDGVGLVSAKPGAQGAALHQPELPKTKALSPKGRKMLIGGVAAVGTLIVAGILMSGQPAQQAQIAEQAPVAPPAAPDARQLEQQRQAALGVDPAAAAQAEADAAAELERQRVAAGGAPGAPGEPGTPSHSAQFADWLERHHYDQKRARIVAGTQARSAELITESGGGAGGGAGSGGMAMAGMPGAVPGVPYTGQPRPAPLLASLQGLQGLPGAPGTAPTSPQAAAAAQQAQAQAQMAQLAQRALGGGAGVAGLPGARAAADSNVAAQQRNREFLDSAGDPGYLNEPVRAQAAQNEIAAGTIIPAVMLTGINSQLPGTIVAQVRQNVFDTFDFQRLLIPQGSRLIGRYSSDVSQGQQRVLVAWDEMIFPNGSRIALGGMQATDPIGASGMRDEVHTHFWRIWGNALMVSLLGVAAQQSQPQNANTNQAAGTSQQATGAAMESLNETASEILQRNLNMAPTLVIRPGYTFNVLVNKSVALPVFNPERTNARAR